MRSIRRNILAILWVGIVIGYAFIEFETYTTRVLFISTLFFLAGGMTFAMILSRRIFLNRFSGKEILILMKYEIVLWTVSGIILLFPGGLKYTAAFLSGLSIYTVFAVGYYWIRFGSQKRDPDSR